MLAHALMAAAITTTTAQPELRVLDRLDLPAGHQWLGTLVGGISGIDYEFGWDAWVMISDDKGEHGPVRGYLADVQIEGERLTAVEVTLLLPMSWGTGERMKGPQFDAEAVRFLPHRDYFGEPSMVFATEGAPTQGQPPRIYEVCTGATRMDSWTAPVWAHTEGRSKGVRNNRAYESIAIVADRIAYVASEEPLQQDGETFVRLTMFDLDKPETEPLRELAYAIDPPKAGAPGAQNGLVELYGLAGGRLLAMERSWSLSREQSIRIYLVETEGATDVLGRDELVSGGFEPVRKSLVADLGSAYGNAEGMCIGPVLESGNRSLLLCTDNNFAPGMPSTFVLCEIVDPEGLVVPADRLSGREAYLDPRDGAH